MVDHAMCGTCICQLGVVSEVWEREGKEKIGCRNGFERKLVFVYIYLLCERENEIKEKQDHLYWWC